MKKIILPFFVFAFVILGSSHAQNIHWIGGTGNWDVASNWASGSVPTFADKVTLATGDVVTIPAGLDAQIGHIFLANGGTLTIEQNASLSVDGAAHTAHGVDLLGGILTNHGTINSNQNIGLRAILVNPNSTFINSASGTIYANNAVESGITVSASSTFSNAGHINIGPNLGRDGLEILLGTSPAPHDNTGQINILGAGPAPSYYALEQRDPGFINDGIICIDQSIPNPFHPGHNNPLGSGTLTTNTTCSSSIAVLIPTLGEWALIIFGLIVLSLGAVYVMRWNKIQSPNFLIPSSD